MKFEQLPNGLYPDFLIDYRERTKAARRYLETESQRRQQQGIEPDGGYVVAICLSHDGTIREEKDPIYLDLEEAYRKAKEDEISNSNPKA